jgi:hypothetical protein
MHFYPSKPTVSVKLLGAGVTPETVRAGELGEFIANFEKALTEMAIARGDIVPEKIEGDADVSLVGIGLGSDALTFTLTPDIVPSHAAISGAIADRDYADVPTRSHVALVNISKQAVKLKWAVEFEEDRRLNVRQAVISEVDPVPEPKVVTATGGTTVYGRLIRIGGVAPKAMVLLPNDEHIYVDLTESMAKELASRDRLYNEVGIDGVATWNVKDWQILHFKATRVTAYQPHKMNAVQAFEALADAARGRWDDVDVVKYVNELRGREGTGRDLG